MASRKFYAQCQKRKAIVKDNIDTLKEKKTYLKKVFHKNKYLQIIETLNKKISNLNLSNEQRNVLIKEREIYQAKVNSVSEITNEQKWQLQFDLNKFGRLTAITRLQHRCVIKNCSRARGIGHRFRLCKSHHMELANAGYLPGRIRQESW